MPAAFVAEGSCSQIVQFVAWRGACANCSFSKLTAAAAEASCYFFVISRIDGRRIEGCVCATSPRGWPAVAVAQM
jgi:hypothetical protein